MDDATRLSRCSECGAPLSTDTAEGLCPACLMAAAAAPMSDLTGNEATVLAEHRGQAMEGRPQLAPGQAFGPYRIEKLLGRGGMGDVYEAEHVEQGRRVALKLLNQRLAHAEDRARFLREGQLAASMSHRHTVYIFGSEEIAGTPVIAMELLSGGTLKDRVQKLGPLAPAPAVDAILQVIAGLDAAQATGILHRDIKPANCFTDRDGTVKVGDFGLSISTAARDLSEIAAGLFQGTPQFAAPEQLRGEALDVRADIYAVGVTLYYLLTAQLPFDDRDLTTLVTRVKNEPPRSPRQMQTRVPRGLAAVVLRCLAKDRTERIQTYAALEDRLRPFSSAGSTPATLGLRFGAGAIDQLLLTIPFAPVNVILALRGDPDNFIRWLFPLQITLMALYYGLQEGLGGATIGKRLVGLRVTDVNSQPPGMARALARAVIYLTPTMIISLPTLIMGQARLMQWATESPLLGALSGWGVWLLIGLLFSTARRRNRFAAVHDLVTGTRVVRRATRSARPSLDVAPSAGSAAGASSDRRYGPYDVVGPLTSTDSGELLIGFDSRLRRHVWIHLLRPGAAPLDPGVRDVGRAARLRWLSGRRSVEEAWDAYEALDGAPLLRVAAHPHKWRHVRYWLRDLATELEAGLGDASLPTLALDRVWITGDGHAKLLDFHIRTPDSPDSSDSQPNLASAQAFLASVAERGLSGALSPTPIPSRPVVLSLPLSARVFVQTLARRGYASLRDVVAGLGPLMTRVDELHRWRRALSVTLCGLGPMLIAAFMLPIMSFLARSATPSSTALEFSARYLTGMPVDATGDQARERDAVEMYLVSNFGRAVTDEQFWSNPFKTATLRPMRPAIDRALRNHPTVSAEELATAGPALERFQQALDQYRSVHQRIVESQSIVPVVMFSVAMLLTALAGLVTACVFRGGLLLRVFSLAVVTKDGSEVSRLRALGRAAITWASLPGFLFALCVGLMTVISDRAPNLWYRNPVWLLLLALSWLFPVGLVVAIRRPERGLQDWLARTWIVPR